MGLAKFSVVYKIAYMHCLPVQKVYTHTHRWTSYIYIPFKVIALIKRLNKLCLGTIIWAGPLLHMSEQDCCLTPGEQFFSYSLARTNQLHWDNDVCMVLGVSDCCLTPTQQFLSYIMARTS